MMFFRRNIAISAPENEMWEIIGWFWVVIGCCGGFILGNVVVKNLVGLFFLG